MKDVCALLLDHKIGEDKDSINLSRMRKILEKDKKFALTFRLNLESILRNETVLRGIGAPSAYITQIYSRIQNILEAMPKVDKKWSNPWWNVDVETPQIFGKPLGI